MSTTLTIPAKLIPDVRESLFSLMGDAAEEIERTLMHPDRELYPEWFEKERKQLEDVFALLDLIGWPADGESREVEVDLREYGWSLKEALDSFLPLMEGELEEADANDRYRASKGKPPRKAEITARLAAFREFMPLVERRVREIE
jgi:hypothetical protein